MSREDLQENIDWIEDIVSLNPLFSLRQIKEKLLETDKVKMSISTIKNALGKQMITLKQVHRELDRVNSINLRREYYNKFNWKMVSLIFTYKLKKH